MSARDQATMPASSPAVRMLPWLGIALVVIVLDQVTKASIVDRFDLHDSIRITPFFNIVRAHNTGAAFSFLAGAAGWQRWFFLAVGILAAVFIVWMLWKHPQQKLFCLALALILGGAIGNVIDRALHGYVVDFVQLHWAGWYFPAFNVADMAITGGAVGLILDELLRVRRSR